MTFIALLSCLLMQALYGGQDNLALAVAANARAAADGDSTIIVEQQSDSLQGTELSELNLKDLDAPAGLRRPTTPAWLERWDNVVGAALGGVLAFAAALVILVVERALQRRRAMLVAKTTLRVYRGGAVPLLNDVLSDAPGVQEGYGQAVACLRFFPILSAQFEPAIAQLGEADPDIGDHAIKFLEYAATAERIVQHLREHVAYARDHEGEVLVDIQAQLMADLGLLRRAVAGANHQAQEVQRQLSRFYLLHGARWRRLKRRVKRWFTHRSHSEIVTTEDWDVLPAGMESEARAAVAGLSETSSDPDSV